jgi:hypothetical protein
MAFKLLGATMKFISVAAFAVYFCNPTHLALACEMTPLQGTTAVLNAVSDFISKTGTVQELVTRIDLNGMIARVQFSATDGKYCRVERYRVETGPDCKISVAFLDGQPEVCK